MQSTGLATAVTSIAISPCRSYIFAGIGPNLRIFKTGEPKQVLEWRALDGGSRISNICCKVDEESKTWMVVVCGGRAFRVAIFHVGKESDVHLASAGKISYADDWVWNVLLLSWNILVVGLSHSILDFYKVEVGSSISLKRLNRITCCSNELTWCVGLWYDAFTVVAASGTSFGDIILMNANIDAGVRQAKAEAVSYKKRGHTGPVMRTVFSKDGCWLVSASVDRTARLWKRTIVENSLEYHSVQTFYGHLGRVWDVALWDQTGPGIVTVSEDKTCRMWRSFAPNERSDVISQHAGSIWTVAACRDYVVTGGEDGVVKTCNIAEDGSNVKEDNVLVRCKLPSDSQSSTESKSAKNDEAVRCIKILSHQRVLLATNKGRLLLTHATHERGPKNPSWQVLHKNTEGIAFSPYTLKVVSNHVFVGDVEGYVHGLKVSKLCDKPRGAANVDTSLSIGAFGEERRMVMGIYLAKSNDSVETMYHLFIASPHGALYFWKYDSSSNAAHLVAKLSPECPTRKGLVTAVKMIFKKNVVLVGDRGGRIYAYRISTLSRAEGSPQSSLSTMEHDLCLRPCSVLRLHSDRISVLTSFQNPGVTLENDNIAYFSAGYDGLICHLSFKEDCIGLVSSHKLPIRLDTITNVYCPVSRAPDIPTTMNVSRMIVAGFHGTDFIVWNNARETEIFRERCGNWHRPFELTLQTDPNDDINTLGIENCSFAYWRAREFYLIESCLRGERAGSRDNAMRYGAGCHGLRANDVLWSSADGGVKANIITAGEDTMIRITDVVYSGKIQQYSQILTNHTSGVICLDRRKYENDREVVVSGDGLGELIFWTQASNELWTFCGKFPGKRLPTQEHLMASHRITSVTLLASQSGRARAVAGDSNGALTVVQFHLGQKGSKHDLVVKPVFSCVKHSGSVLSMSSIEETNDACFIFSGDTRGSVIAWSLTMEGVLELKAMEQQIHQSGVNSMSTITLNESLIIVATAGDDETVNFLTFDCEKGIFCGKTPAPRKHAAAVTGISSLRTPDDRRLVFSVGADQKLVCVELTLANSADSPKQVMPRVIASNTVSVTDPSSVAARLKENDVQLVVAGCGVETFNYCPVNAFESN